MPDRYEDGILALQNIETPDQWDEIRQRARGGLIVPLGEDRRRGWPSLLVVAAALMVVLGVAALLLREGDDLTTNPSDAGLTPPIDGPGGSSSTRQPPSTTGQASTTQQPSTTDAPVAGFVACPRALELTTSTAPTGWSTTMRPAEETLPPNSPKGVDPDFAGLFPGPTTADNVFVIAGLPGRQDDAFIPFPGPLTGRNAQIAPFEGGWYLEVVIPHPAADCWITLEAIGMTQNEAIQFAQGLSGS